MKRQIETQTVIWRDGEGEGSGDYSVGQVKFGDGEKMWTSIHPSGMQLYVDNKFYYHLAGSNCQ